MYLLFRQMCLVFGKEKDLRQWPYRRQPAWALKTKKGRSQTPDKVMMYRFQINYPHQPHTVCWENNDAGPEEEDEEEDEEEEE